MAIDLNRRQKEILEIVKKSGPISGEEIASRLNTSRATLRPHLASLTMSGLLEARPRIGYFYAGKETKHLLADFFRQIKVEDVKSLPAVVREETSVYDAVVTLFLEDVGTLFVVDEEGLLKGVLSRKDLLKTSIGSSDLGKVPVAVVMTRMPNVVMLDPGENVLQAAFKIIEFEVDSLPVVKKLSPGKYKLNGKVSKTTLVRLLMELGGSS